MSDAPERIWASTGLYYDYVHDWSEGSWGLDGLGVEYIRADHVEALLKADREKTLREALAACEKALSDMQRDNPDRHDALPYIEDCCGACQDAILTLISKDATP